MADERKDIKIRIAADVSVSNAAIDALIKKLVQLDQQVKITEKRVEAAQAKKEPLGRIAQLQQGVLIAKTRYMDIHFQLQTLVNLRELVAKEISEGGSEVLRKAILDELKELRKFQRLAKGHRLHPRGQKLPQWDIVREEQSQMLDEAREQALQGDIDKKLNFTNSANSRRFISRYNKPTAEAIASLRASLEFNARQTQSQQFEATRKSTQIASPNQYETLDTGGVEGGIRKAQADQQAKLVNQQREQEQASKELTEAEQKLEETVEATRKHLEEFAGELNQISEDSNKDLEERQHKRVQKGNEPLSEAARNAVVENANAQAKPASTTQGFSIAEELATNPAIAAARDAIDSQKKRIANLVSSIEEGKKLLAQHKRLLEENEAALKDAAKNSEFFSKEEVDVLRNNVKESQERVTQTEKQLAQLRDSALKESGVLNKLQQQLNVVYETQKKVAEEKAAREAAEAKARKDVLQGNVPLNAEETAKTEARERARKTRQEAVDKVNIGRIDQQEVEQAKKSYDELTEAQKKFDENIKTRGNYAIKIMNSFNLTLDEAIKKFRQVDPQNKKKLLPAPTLEEIKNIREYVELTQKLNAATARGLSARSGKKTIVSQSGHTKEIDYMPEKAVITPNEVVVADKVAEKIKRVKQLVDETGVAVEAAIKQVGGGNRYIDQQVGLWFKVDKQVKSAAKAAEKFVEAEQKAAGKKPPSVFGNNFSAAFAGFEMRFAGQQAQMLTKQIILPMQNYAQYAGRSHTISAEWLDTQQALTESVAEMGKSLAEVALPTFQDIAQVVRQIADVLNENPAIAKGVLYTAAGGFVVGSIANVIGAGLTAYSAMQYAIPMAKGLLNEIKIAKAGKAAFGTAAEIATNGAVTAGQSVAKTNLLPALTGLAKVIVPVSIMFVALKAASWALTNAMNEQQHKLMDGMEKLSEVEKDVVNKTQNPTVSAALLVMAKNASQEELKRRPDLQKALDAAKAEENKTTTAGRKKDPSDAAVVEYINFQKAIIESEKQYGKNRLQLIKDYQKAALDIEKKYADQLAEIDADEKKIREDADDDAKDFERKRKDDRAQFMLDEARAYEDYYRKRMQDTRDYNIDVQRAEEDHQKKVKEQIEDHNDKMRDLLDERDAFGMIKELQSFEKERRRTEDDYRIDMTRKDEDFAIKLQDQETEFRIERQRALEDFQLRLKDEDQQKAIDKERKLRDLEEKRVEAKKEHDDELKQLQEDHREKLAELDSQHVEEMDRLRQDFVDRLRDLDAALLGEQKMRNDYYKAMNDDLRAWLEDQNGVFASSLPNWPQKAGGGYLPRGIYQVGEQGDEFALTRSTTRFMERAVGSRLTQENVMQLAMSGRGSGNYTQNITARFEGALSADEKREMRKMMRNTTRQGFEDLLSAIGA